MADHRPGAGRRGTLGTGADEVRRAGGCACRPRGRRGASALGGSSVLVSRREDEVCDDVGVRLRDGLSGLRDPSHRSRSSQIQQVVRAAARADSLHLTDNVPVAVSDFDVNSTIGIVGRQQDRRVLAPADPSKNRNLLAAPAPLAAHACSVHNPPAPLEIEHMFYTKGILGNTCGRVKALAFRLGSRG